MSHCSFHVPCLQGDPGSPLVVKQGTSWVQAGIVSFGGVCPETGLPVAFTRVSDYVDWIANQFGGNPPTQSFVSSGAVVGF